MTSKKQAIIDLGSNTTRMIIMEVLDNGGYRLADDARATVRLAEQMAPDNTIKPSALNRATDAMRLFRSITDYHRVTGITACATAAIREAANQQEILRTLDERSGILFKVLTREEEAYFGYLGVANSTDFRDGIVIDIGGGSMEITGIRDRKVVESVSLPLGSLSLTERFIPSEKPSDSQLNALEDYVKHTLKSVPWLHSWEGSEVIGIGGTYRTIAKVHQRLVNYPFDELHNYVMSPDEVAFIYNNLKSSKPSDRHNVPGLTRDRADIIIGGMAAIVIMLKLLKTPRIRISTYGLREGIFFSTLLQPPVAENVLAFSVDNKVKIYGLDSTHSGQVANLALSLFDAMQEVHRLGSDSRQILWAAAWLHESGYLYNYHNRYNNTFYNIMNDTIFGLTQLETYKVGLIAAFYGAGGIKGRDGLVSMLDKDEAKALRKMGVLLALADAFDRRRSGRVLGLDCAIDKNTVKIRPACKDDCWIERKSAESVRPHFEKAFDLTLAIDTPE
ncbi:MAG TPA: Ppx/GppA phosphatase family protein [Methanocella sp.]|nr:Ppx/GppA phosphatase family protein [Methanocella sp.]